MCRIVEPFGVLKMVCLKEILSLGAMGGTYFGEVEVRVSRIEHEMEWNGPKREPGWERGIGEILIAEGMQLNVATNGSLFRPQQENL